MNAGDIKSKLSNGNGRAELLAKSDKPMEDRIAELYRVAFARAPSSEELATAVAYLNEPRLDAQGKPIDPTRSLRENLHDLLWALINTKEFLFNH
jgi:hypothetical protein